MFYDNITNSFLKVVVIVSNRFYSLIFLSSFRTFQHDGKNPNTFAEKEEFKSFIKSQARDYHNEVNYQEAVREYYRGYAKKTLSGALVELLQAQREENGYRLTSQSSEFE